MICTSCINEKNLYESSVTGIDLIAESKENDAKAIITKIKITRIRITNNISNTL